MYLDLEKFSKKKSKFFCKKNTNYGRHFQPSIAGIRNNKYIG